MPDDDTCRTCDGNGYVTEYVATPPELSEPITRRRGCPQCYGRGVSA